MQQVMKLQQQNWVRRVEHIVLRVVSLIFSLVSAHAILWFFSALDWVDLLQPWVKWGIAGGFGVLGYFVSRGLAHRFLNKERVTAYLFICGVFELVEVVCNYSMAASSAESIAWLWGIHGVQHQVLVFLVYVVLSIIPVVTVMLAWVDMDLERAKQGYEVRGFGAGVPATAPGPRPLTYGMPQPKTMVQQPTSAGVPLPAPVPTYPQGYTGVPAAPASVAPGAQGSSGWFNGMRQGLNGVRDRFPFGRRDQGSAVPQPNPPTMAPPSTAYGVQGNGVAPTGQ